MTTTWILALWLLTPQLEVTSQAQSDMTFESQQACVEYTVNMIHMMEDFYGASVISVRDARFAEYMIQAEDGGIVATQCQPHESI